MSPHDHQIFKEHPLDGRVTLSTGEAPTPYHIYDGYGLFIGGDCDLNVARQLLQPEKVAPVQTRDGRGLMGIWICNFTEASLGPHHELQFSLFVSERSVPPLDERGLKMAAMMLTRTDVQMMCHGLWNNTPNVVAYNREYLSLNARQTDSHIERTAHTLRFTFNDHATGQAILAGTMARPQRASQRANWDFLRALGFKQAMALRQQAWVNLNVLNPVGVVLDRNAAARTLTANATTILRYSEPRIDTLDFGATPYRALQFKPRFVQYMDGFKFVYLKPE